MWPFSRHLGIKAVIHAAKSRFFLYLVSVYAVGDYIHGCNLDRVYSCKRGDRKYLYPILRSAAPFRPNIGLGNQFRDAPPNVVISIFPPSVVDLLVLWVQRDSQQPGS